MSTATRAFVGRLSELSVYDPLGDKVGRVRDVVVVFSATRSRPRVIGLVVEVAGRKRIFVPMTRVTSVEGGQVITTGLVNMRRFEQRANETLVVAELFDRPVQVAVDGEQVSGTIEDVGIEQSYARDWQVSRAFIRKTSPRSALAPFGRRRGETFIVPIEEISGLATPAAEQSAARLIEAYEDLKPADLAEVIHELSPKRRAEVAAALDDERLADVIEELPEDDQVEILASLETDRAADILEAITGVFRSDIDEDDSTVVQRDDGSWLVDAAPVTSVVEPQRKSSRPRWRPRSSCAAPRSRRPPASTWAWCTSSASCASRRITRSGPSWTRTSSPSPRRTRSRRSLASSRPTTSSRCRW